MRRNPENQSEHKKFEKTLSDSEGYTKFLERGRGEKQKTFGISGDVWKRLTAELLSLILLFNRSLRWSAVWIDELGNELIISSEGDVSSLNKRHTPNMNAKTNQPTYYYKFSAHFKPDDFVEYHNALERHYKALYAFYDGLWSNTLSPRKSFRLIQEKRRRTFIIETIEDGEFWNGNECINYYITQEATDSIKKLRSSYIEKMLIALLNDLLPRQGDYIAELTFSYHEWVDESDLDSFQLNVHRSINLLVKPVDYGSLSFLRNFIIGEKAKLTKTPFRREEWGFVDKFVEESPPSGGVDIGNALITQPLDEILETLAREGYIAFEGDDELGRLKSTFTEVVKRLYANEVIRCIWEHCNNPIVGTKSRHDVYCGQGCKARMWERLTKKGKIGMPLVLDELNGREKTLKEYLEERYRELIDTSPGLPEEIHRKFWEEEVPKIEKELNIKIKAKRGRPPKKKET